MRSSQCLKAQLTPYGSFPPVPSHPRVTLGDRQELAPHLLPAHLREQTQHLLQHASRTHGFVFFVYSHLPELSCWHGSPPLVLSLRGLYTTAVTKPKKAHQKNHKSKPSRGSTPRGNLGSWLWSYVFKHCLAAYFFFNSVIYLANRIHLGLCSQENTIIFNLSCMSL